MHTKVTSSNGTLTLRENRGLSADICQLPNDDLISFNKTKESIGYIHLITKFLNEFLRPSQIVSWDPRVKVMNSLELETTMEEVEPLWTVHVHGRPQHLLRKRLSSAKIGGAHREMAEGDLDM